MLFFTHRRLIPSLLSLAGMLASANLAQAEEDRHWAFVRIERPAVPVVERGEWVVTPVDAFVLAALEGRGLPPAPRAGTMTLLRRVYLDLVGIPPTPAEQRAWAADRAPDAWGRLVDRLLARPEHGERWARHWLDVARYAESNGYERDATKPNAWRYRDWVIEALNSDKPFDRFLAEQLAGDELDGTNASTQIATTFLRLGTWDDEPVDPPADRYDQLDDLLGTTMTTFLAVTIRCARCHDHKFEPFSQRDYYRVLAVFNPLKRPETIKSATHREEFDRLVGTPEELAAYRDGIKRADRRVAELKQQIDQFRSAVRKRVLELAAGVDPGGKPLPAEAALAFLQPDAKRTPAQKELVKKYAKAVDQAVVDSMSEAERAKLAGWESSVERVNATRPVELPRAYIWYEDTPKPPVTRLFKRGDPYSPGDEIALAIPEVLGARPAVAPSATASSTGRRKWLADWMTSRDNPLVARVFVNRIWQHHFGEGLVTTESNFGEMGDVPVHQQLLDWLAADLIENGWQIKRLHRLIVGSSLYRMSSRYDAACARIDPDERLLWRFRHRRLDAEVVRDSVLSVSGQLNRTMHGPSFYPELPQAVLAGQSRPGSGWGKSSPWEQARRSVYIFSKRSLAVPELDLLDAPNSSDSCEQRAVSTTGPQALTFLNGVFMHDSAGRMADRVRDEAGRDQEQQVVLAFRLALARDPGPGELDASLGFLAAQAAQVVSDSQSDPAVARQRALAAFCLVLLNTNEFTYTR